MCFTFLFCLIVLNCTDIHDTVLSPWTPKHMQQWYVVAKAHVCGHSHKNVYPQTLSHVEYYMIHHSYTVGHITLSLWSSPLIHTYTQTSCKPYVIVLSNYYSSLGSHIPSFFSHTSLSLFVSVAMPIDSVIYYCLATLSSCLHILIAICTSSIHQFSSSFSHHFTHQFIHSLCVFPCLSNCNTFLLSSDFCIGCSSLKATDVKTTDWSEKFLTIVTRGILHKPDIFKGIRHRCIARNTVYPGCR